MSGERPLGGTLVDVLRWRAAAEPELVAFRFLMDGESEIEELSYGALDRRACALAARLQSEASIGDRVLLVFPPGLDFIAAFFGCLYAGTVALAVWPPRPARSRQFVHRVLPLVEQAEPRVVLTTNSLRADLGGEIEGAPALGRMLWVAVEESGGREDGWRETELAEDEIAFLQYTSGSTSSPKGVMVSHANLMHNLAAIEDSFGLTRADTIVSWLPPYHDMGLVGCTLQPVFAGIGTVLMSPDAFIQRPHRWLRAISHFGGTVGGGPNFAYDLCVRRTSQEQRAQLDLARWRVAFNGAEPIDAKTLASFSAHFDPCGFDANAFVPCYGLAEATLLVSCAGRARGRLARNFVRSALEGGAAVEAAGDGPDVRELVRCGVAPPDQRVVIVDPASRTTLDEGSVGEIWVSGPSVAPGYWSRSAGETGGFGTSLARNTRAAYLRTGDLGFLWDGELFVTGRLKELIIIDGRNHDPVDLERTVSGSEPSLDASACVAFSVDVSGKEALVIMASIRRSAEKRREEIVRAVRRALSAEHGVKPFDVWLVRAPIPKTPSGKSKRLECRDLYLSRGPEEGSP